MINQQTKTILCSLFVVCAVALLILRSPDVPSLIGAWEVNDNGQEIYMEFNGSGESKWFVSDGVEEVALKGKWSIDRTKRPVALSLRGVEGLDHPIHTIIEFLDKDTIRMGGFAPRWRLRPIAFDSKQSFLLKRVERK